MQVVTRFDLETLHRLNALPVSEQWHGLFEIGWARARTVFDTPIEHHEVYMLIDGPDVYYRCDEAMIGFLDYCVDNREVIRLAVYKWLERMNQVKIEA